MQRTGVLVLGKTGTGKSTLIRETIVPACESPVIVLDPMCEYRYGVRYRTSSAMARDILSRDLWGTDVLVLQPESEDEEVAFFELVNALDFECVIVCEEIDAYASSRRLHPEVSDLMRRGRHTGKSFIFAARRPSEIHPDVRSQSDFIISFRQTEPRDIAFIGSMYEGADQVRDLTIFKETGEDSQYCVYGEYISILPYSSILKPSNLKTDPVGIHEIPDKGDAD